MAHSSEFIAEKTKTPGNQEPLAVLESRPGFFPLGDSVLSHVQCLRPQRKPISEGRERWGKGQPLGGQSRGTR